MAPYFLPRHNSVWTACHAAYANTIFAVTWIRCHSGPSARPNPDLCRLFLFRVDLALECMCRRLFVHGCDPLQYIAYIRCHGFNSGGILKIGIARPPIVSSYCFVNVAIEVIEKIPEEQPRVRGQEHGNWSSPVPMFVVAGAFPAIENSRACRSGINTGASADLSDDRESFQQARKLLREAIAHDPHYAPAYSYSSYLQILIIGQGWSQDVEVDGALTIAAAEAAIRYDQNDAMALAVYGHMQSFVRKDYETAMTFVDRAIVAGPSCDFGLGV